MIKTTNSIENFYQYAENNNYLNDELKTVFETKEAKSDFFEVCKKFENVSLNAIKFNDDELHTVPAVFKYSDIALAKDEAKKFYILYHIKNVDEYIETIHKLYFQAVDDDDDRQTSGFIKNEDICRSLGYYGTFFNFGELPEDVWNKISKELKDYLKTS